MCIGVWTLRHPDYALILCTNRDEFLDRPTQDAHFHSFGDGDDGVGDGDAHKHKILSGRDVQAGGSWFGINKSGRVALLTNITEPASRKWNTSRGSLVSSFLESDLSHPLEDEIGKIVPGDDAKFAGFNLLVLAPRVVVPRPAGDDERQPEPEITYTALFTTNHGGGGTLTSRVLAPDEVACGAMSNGVDGAGAEMWPKVVHARRAFKESVLGVGDGRGSSVDREEKEAELVKQLFDVLSWHPPTPITQRAELRQTVQVLPVPITLGGPASSPTPTYYGTRTATVLLVTKNGEVTFIERDVWVLDRGSGDQSQVLKADEGSQRIFRFKLDVKSSMEENVGL